MRSILTGALFLALAACAQPGQPAGRGEAGSRTPDRPTRSWTEGQARQKCPEAAPEAAREEASAPSPDDGAAPARTGRSWTAAALQARAEQLCRSHRDQQACIAFRPGLLKTKQNTLRTDPGINLEPGVPPRGSCRA